jgi:hypothetical protein
MPPVVGQTRQLRTIVLLVSSMSALPLKALAMSLLGQSLRRQVRLADLVCPLCPQ